MRRILAVTVAMAAMVLGYHAIAGLTAPRPEPCAEERIVYEQQAASRFAALAYRDWQRCLGATARAAR